MTKYSAAQQEQLSRIGTFLRETREKQGKSLEDIAIRTYIRPAIISALEAADSDRLPEPIFVQGFIRRYAEVLGLNGLELAQQFAVPVPTAPRFESPNPLPSTSTVIPETTQIAAPEPALAESKEPKPVLTSELKPSTALHPETNGPAADTSDEQISTNGLGTEPDALTIPTSAASPQPASAHVTENETSARSEPPVTQPQTDAIAAEPTLPSDPPDLAPPMPPPATSYSRANPSASARTNFTPYALAGILALLVVGAVALLANLSGSRPAAEIEQAAEPEPPEAVEPPAPPPAPPATPEPEPAPISDAPVYVSIETTDNAWMSVVADGQKIFEGTLPPGESQLWEAQQSIDVFTGNAGAVLLSHNGSEPAPMGEPGKISQAVYTADSAE